MNQLIQEERINYIASLESRDRLCASEKQLSQNIYERGVDDKGFGRIRSKGDVVLFGGHTTEDMKKRRVVLAGSPSASGVLNSAVFLYDPDAIPFAFKTHIKIQYCITAIDIQD